MYSKKILTMLALSMMLTGCSSLDEIVKNQIREEAGIENKDEYQNYQEYVDNGVVDEKGNYISGETSDNKDGIRVTFSINSNLDVKYYYDEKKTIIVDISNCYLKPGDMLYADVKEDASQGSNLYKFDSFKVYSYDTGKRKEVTDILGDFNSSGVVIKLNDDCDYKQLSIEPVGKREHRKVELSAKYQESENTSYPVTDGIWTINNTVLEPNVSEYEFNSYTDYLVSYKFDPSTYFLLDTEPNCYYRSNREGVVVFDQITTKDSITNYKVNLHKLIDLSIVSDAKRTVKVDDGEYKLEASGVLKLTGKRYGEIVVITSDSEWKTLENSRELICISVELKQNPANMQYVYTMLIPTPGDVFVFDPNEYSYEHGKVDFYVFGMPITTVIEIPRGATIEYKEHSADEGYCIVQGEHRIVVGDDEKTKNELNSISFVDRVDVEVNLPQPVAGGEVVYYLNNKKVTGSSIKAYNNDVITMEFYPWEGWMLKSGIKDDIQFKVKNITGQTVTAGNIDIYNDLFVEDENHKPELTVALNKSLGENIKVEVKAGGIEPINASYEGGFLKNNHIIIDEEKIGSEKGIEISLTNSALETGKAIKILVERKTKSGSDTPQIIYVTDMTKTIAPIDVYWKDDPATSKVWYQSIVISLSLIDISTYNRPSVADNSSIKVINNTSKIELKSGDYIETEQEVLVIISPDTGYYLTGKKVSEDIYQNIMDYDDFLDDIDDIVENHPVLKILKVSLDEGDTYAKYEYFLDGDAVSGTISVREGQELKLKYNIVDDDWKLTEKAGGFLGFGGSDTEITKEISISSDLDGTTISRSTFGFDTEKR